MGIGLRRNIPLPISSFVGREAEQDELCRLLAGNRLVTLLGPPGVGKTRLAAEVAAARSSSPDAIPEDGPVWVDLAPVGGSGGVVVAIGRAVALPERAGAPSPDTIVGHLRDARLHLVLDNCEHVLAEVAEVVQAIVEHCHETRIVATSRQPLGLSGEVRFPVAGLSVPEAEARIDVAAVTATAAGRLFVERATAIQPSFAITAANAPSVADICRRLDGIPLAIELAAARVTVLSPQQIARELDNRFALLGRAHRPLGGRHETLEEAIDWSHTLLTPAERTLFRRIGIFGAEFGLDGVRGTCLGGEITSANLLELLASLVSKSLVVACTDVDPARYRMLENIRSYAQDRLGASGEGPTMAKRLADWFLALVEAIEPHLTGPEQAAWLAYLDADYVDIERVMRWSLEQETESGSLRLAAALALYWRLRNRFRSGGDLLAAALDKCPNAPDRLRARGLWGAGLLALVATDLARAEQLLVESVALARAADDKVLQARALMLLGNARIENGTPSASAEVLQQSIALARGTDDSWCLTHALALRGHALVQSGDTESADAILREALALARRSGEPQGLRISLAIVGDLARARGQFVSAKALLEEALKVARGLQEPYATTMTLLSLGQMATTTGDFEDARVALNSAVAVSAGTDTAIAGACLSALGHLEWTQGNLVEARSMLQQAVAQSRTLVSQRALLIMTQVALAEGRTELAISTLEGLTEQVDRPPSNWIRGWAFHLLGDVTRATGDLARSESSYLRSLDLRDDIGDQTGLVGTIEALGRLLATTGSTERGVRLMAAATEARTALGVPRPPVEEPGYGADLAAAQAAVAGGGFERAWKAGSKLSVSEAVNYALRGRGRVRARPATGWESLTRAERQVAQLVAEGLTNAQIGERLFVSFHTAKLHVAAALAKVGVSSRAELAREVTRRGL